MSPENSAQAASPWATRAAAALATSAMLGLAGCDAPPQTPIYLPAPSYNTPLAPHGVCQEVMSDSETERKDAQRCLGAMKGASVALVTFGDISTDRAEKIAVGTEALVKKATNGLVTLNVSVVKASQAAQQQAFTAEHPDCIDSLQAEHMASAAVDATMPELANEDFIVAATTDPSCSGTIEGVADTSGGRRADIYGVGGGDDPTEDIITAAHEIGHNLGLGHASVQVPNSSGPKLRLRLDGKPFDLRAYATNSTLYEYGMPGDVMGGGGQTFGRTNPLHLADLQWPNIVLGGNNPAKELDTGWITLSATDAAAGEFITDRLNTPLVLEDPNTKKVTEGHTPPHPYCTVAFVPDTYHGKMDGFQLFVADPDNNIDEFGVAIDEQLAGKTDGKIITYDNQQWEVRLDEQTVSVREVPAP